MKSKTISSIHPSGSDGPVIAGSLFTGAYALLELFFGVYIDYALWDCAEVIVSEWVRYKGGLRGTRHRDIRTTLRYAHVSDRTKREKYEEFLRL